jgi:hypothetical protein
MPAGAAEVTYTGKRVRIASLAAIILSVGVAAGLMYTRFAPTNSVYEFADGLIARVASDLAGLDARWHRSRNSITAHRDTIPGIVQCADEDQPQWRAREIANRIEAGQWVVGQCLQVRIDQ